MENTTNDIWFTLLNSAHYFFLAALVVLLLVFLIRMLRGKSKEKEGMRSHHRTSKRREKNEQ